MGKPDATMPPEPRAPLRRAPEGAIDTHVHMLAGRDEFLLWEGRVENPAPGPTLDGWLALLDEQMDTLGFSRVVLVHSIFYGTDNSVTREALKRLGGRARGVGLLPDGATEAQIDEFASWGMDAVRLNYVHGGVLDWAGARAMAPALAERGMHIQMLCHMDQHMHDIAADVRALPCPVVFDHVAWPSAGLDPSGEGVETLCALLADGYAHVKLSGLYRLCNAPYAEADALVARLIDANPQACLWGSDWPHVMLNGAQMPSGAALLDAFDRVVTSDTLRQRILCDNPRALYRF
ncbi:amidohydrolase family protein [Sulfitobacter sp. F26169L]|uniref:amidohydrolase family protein n=1 Tax=Sulfitobacter sp. F26169L TaxID=2996015 RepID=UPI002260CCCB|nr:amidohydrolase family protein [Sulfitobacter sp. F26169L]MCX7566402.1 amidohydrolase family protein [Sulfitobacter sp. F26169L]